MDDFRQRMEDAHQRAAQLAAETERLVEVAYDLRHHSRNLRHAIGLLRAVRLLQVKAR